MKYCIPLFFLSLVAFGQNNLSISISQQILKKDSIRKEFTMLYDLLKTVHPDPFNHCTKTSLEHCFDSLSKGIQSDLSLVDYYLKTSFLLARLKDGHTTIDNSFLHEGMQHRIVFPFALYKIKKQVIIRASGLPDYQGYIGKTLTKINGKDLTDIVAKLSAYVSIEGENETAINEFLSSFPFYYFLMDTTHAFSITYTDSIGGHTSEKKLKGIEYNTFQENTKKPIEPIEPIVHKFTRSNLAILTIHAFDATALNIQNMDYKKSIDDFFNRVAALKITNIIVDVRDNSGGDAEVANYLFAYLTNKPYFFFDYIGKKYKIAGDWKKYAANPASLDELDKIATQPLNNLFCQTEKTKPTNWWFLKQKGRKNYFKGNVVTLINAGSEGTAGHFVALVKDNHIGKLLGECSQGNYYSNGRVQQFILPYSKLLVNIPTVQFKMRMPNFKYNVKGICPDKEILPLVDDLIIDYDSVLNTVIAELTGRE